MASSKAARCLSSALSESWQGVRGRWKGGGVGGMGGGGVGGGMGGGVGGGRVGMGGEGMKCGREGWE